MLKQRQTQGTLWPSLMNTIAINNKPPVTQLRQYWVRFGQLTSFFSLYLLHHAVQWVSFWRRIILETRQTLFPFERLCHSVHYYAQGDQNRESAAHQNSDKKCSDPVRITTCWKSGSKWSKRDRKEVQLVS